MAEVWYVGVDRVPESLAGLLDGPERSRRQRIALPADRHRFLAAWVLTRLVLGERLGLSPAELRFDRACAHCADPAHGKPVLATAGPRPEFSLSHVGGLAVLAVADHPVGVDVEDATAAPAPSAAALSGLCARELAECRDYPDFARRWTRKEALLKTGGQGLAVHPGRIELDGTTPLTLPAELGRPAEYTLRDLPLPAPYVGAVAVRGPRSPLAVRSGESLVRGARAAAVHAPGRPTAPAPAS
ncbi:Phosphopantetheinyl transferase [Kitasatospora sp. MMS16-BH015]|uniref:4'-phosphopantetheinyl transferase family protein n=1 Tax=Kitasatospora sp. MMS16-BH015 TaxID=2018025 RepID=UPI000CA33F28|nr:4'-phosphopantetheinyl transferase superfamily protein [Kitasatospora sp. MMS16-BH015]AUG78730.1 Phosphopantetheinyl transferase [Kitasatospora sp. MMS16-BH015]